MGKVEILNVQLTKVQGGTNVIGEEYQMDAVPDHTLDTPRQSESKDRDHKPATRNYPGKLIFSPSRFSTVWQRPRKFRRMPLAIVFDANAHPYRGKLRARTWVQPPDRTGNMSGVASHNRS